MKPKETHPLKKRRRQVGLTQKELSRLSGVPQSTISSIETRRAVGRVKTLQALASPLRCRWPSLAEAVED